MRVSLRKTMYVLSSAVVLNMVFWGKSVSMYITYAILSFWFLYLIANLLVANKNSFKTKLILSYFLMIMPILVIAVYALIIWMFNSEIGFRNITRLVSTCLQLFLAWGFGACGYLMFKEKAVDYMFIGGVLSYLFGSVLYAVFTEGFINFVQYLWYLLSKSTTEVSGPIRDIMEVHDLTFAMGLFFLFYLFCDRRRGKSRKRKIFLSALLIFLGLKRIEILALIVSILTYFFLLRWGKTLHYRSMFLAVGFSISCFLFIFLIRSGLLTAICTYFSINTMGRLNNYIYSTKYFEFSPLYMGKGFTWFGRLWGELYHSSFRLGGYAVAASIHSDMLTFYIENGFILTLWWVFYLFNSKVKRIKLYFNNEAAECCLLMTVYMFILYLTDNTFYYAGTQAVFYVIPVCQYCITSNPDLSSEVRMKYYI